MRSVLFFGLVAISGCSTSDQLQRPVYPSTIASEIIIEDSVPVGAVSLGELDAYACANGLITRNETFEDEEGSVLSPDKERLKAKALEEIKNKAAAIGATNIRKLKYQDVGLISPCKGRSGVRASALSFRN